MELGRHLAATRPEIRLAGVAVGPAAAAAPGDVCDQVVCVRSWDDLSQLTERLEAGIGPEAFDAIAVSQVPVDVDPEFAVSLLRDHLRPGGTLLLALHNPRFQDLLLDLLLRDDGDEGATPPEPNGLFISRPRAETLVDELGLMAGELQPVTVPLRPEVEPFVMAAVAAGGDEDTLRDQCTCVSHVLCATSPADELRLSDDASYGRARVAVGAAVDAALRAGVEVGERQPDATAAAGAAELTSSQEPPRVSIVIPVCDQATFTEKCLYAIAANTLGEGSDDGGRSPLEYEVIVVDNGSTDWTMYLLHAMEGDIQVIGNDRNLGFARACNQGAAAARGEYVLFLNNGTVPRDGWLQPLVDLAAGDPAVGVVGAKLLYPDSGTVQHAGLAVENGIPEHVFRGVEADDPRVNETRDLDMVTGACLLIRRALYDELDGMDTQYLNGVEDVDLCLRARDAGYRVVYCSESVLEHHEAVSEGRFDHVRENVRRFEEKWGDRFDSAGVFHPRSPAVPAALTEAEPDGPGDRAAAPETSLRGNWEGSFFLHSSLAFVNRELVLALLQTGQCDLGLIPFEAAQFGAEEDAERFPALAERLEHPLTEAVDFHLRHRWPPDFGPTPAGRLIVMQPWEFGRIPRSWVAPIQRQVDQVWAYTRYVRDCYVDSGIDEDLVRVVPLGVDPERFRPGLEPLFLPTEKKHKFLFVGGTLYRKGIDVLLEAYCGAFGPGDDVCLIIKDMGVGTFYRNQNAGERIRQIQADPGQPEIVYLTQDLPGDQMPRLYAAADALVHPYRGEGFGLPVAEAMACGLPVVVTMGGACDDFCPIDLVYGVPAERRGVRFQEETVGQAWQLEPDPKALADHMRHLADCPEEGRRRGASASWHIRSGFTWSHAAAKAVAALEDLKQTSPQSRSAAAPTRQATAPPAGTAVVVLGSGARADLSGFARALGPFARYDVSLGSEHVLGEQLEAIRQHTEGQEYVAVVRSDVEATVEEVRGLLSLMRENSQIGMLVPGVESSSSQGQGLVDVDYPDPVCTVFRTAALQGVGGFDASFSSGAVFANAARCLRRGGWRVAATADVTFTEAVERVGQILRLGEAQSSAAGAATPSAERQTRETEAVSALEAGDRHRDSGEMELAVEACRRALAAKADFVEAILVLADLLVDTGNLTDATEIIDGLLRLDPDSAWARNRAGVVHYRAGHEQVARDHLERALELQPDLAEARVNLGVLEWETGHLDAAVRQLQQAADLDPGNRDLIANLAIIHVRMGNGHDAQTLLEEFLTHHPHDEEIQRQLAGLQSDSGPIEEAGGQEEGA